jgi:hypothetical protein
MERSSFEVTVANVNVEFRGFLIVDRGFVCIRKFTLDDYGVSHFKMEVYARSQVSEENRVPKLSIPVRLVLGIKSSTVVSQRNPHFKKGKLVIRVRGSPDITMKLGEASASYFLSQFYRI